MVDVITCSTIADSQCHTCICHQPLNNIASFTTISKKLKKNFHLKKKKKKKHSTSYALLQIPFDFGYSVINYEGILILFTATSAYFLT
jgi:hypothetical protein